MDLVLRGVGALMAMACDISVFFLVVRLVKYVVAVPGVRAFDNAGRPVVEWALSWFDRCVRPRYRQLREGVKVVCLLGVLVVLRSLLGALVW